MDNKNSKSESYAVREAENIIENYLKDREMCAIQKDHHLKEKYERLKILTIASLISGSILMLLPILF